MVITSKAGLYCFDTSLSPQVPNCFLQKAKRELNEIPENRNPAVQQMRQFVLNEKSLSCRTNDEFLMIFLRARKYNVNRAFSLLKKYCSFKRKNPDLFSGYDYEILVKFIQNHIFAFLPYRDTDGCAIITLHLDNWNPSALDVSYLKKAIALYLYHSIEDPLTQINGYKVILDVKSNPLKHLRHMTPSNLYLLYSGTLDCFPGRFKGIHIVNMSLTFKAAWTIINPFLSEKLKKRITFHESNSSLAEYFPESMLPVDFGGLLKEVDTSSWLKNALSEESLAKLVY